MQKFFFCTVIAAAEYLFEYKYNPGRGVMYIWVDEITAIDNLVMYRELMADCAGDWEGSQASEGPSVWEDSTLH